jgi:DNA mismatch endonuclease (patch repair protein)
MDRIPVKKRKELMAKVRNKNTDIEIMLATALETMGISFTKESTLPGKPDIVISSSRLAIFCDGDFWHGKNFKNEGSKYNNFWQEKIQTNIKRDKKVNHELHQQGWKVLRFWETDIYDNIKYCADKVLQEIRSARVNSIL